MFIKNGYPIQLFTSAYERFWNSKNSNAKKDSTDSDIYIKIPFIGPASVKFGKTLAIIFKDTFDTTIEPVFTSFKVKNCFRLKSRTPKALCSNVVYEYQCLCDTNNSYIGVTSRPFCTRVEEHLDNNKKRTRNTEDSAVLKHLDMCQKCFEGTRENPLDKFKILRHCTSSYTAKIQEAILIKRFHPKLNVQQFNNGASFTLKVYY